MPTLIVDQPNRRFGGRITGRVLIGRLPSNGVPLTDSSVSRLHAWVSPDGDGRYFVGDTGSLTGTWVNGTAIARRRDLVDGDVIKVGKTQLTFLDSDMVPMDVEQADLTGQPLEGDPADVGVLFECPCGAPAWFKATAVGHNHHCRQCDRTVRIPERSGGVADEIDAPTISEPGVPPEATTIDAADPMMLHEPSAGDLGLTRDEHGLADSGVHRAVTEAALHRLPDDHGLADSGVHVALAAEGGDLKLSVEEHGLSDSGVHRAVTEPELHPTSEPTAELEEAIPEELAMEAFEGFEAPPVEEPPRAKRSLFEARPTRAETFAAAPGAEDVLDLSASELTGAVSAATCSVCHSAIEPADAQTTCPSCGLTFHEECWTENLGCSAYGCPQVNALQPQVETVTEAEQAALPIEGVDEVAEDAGFPWEFIFLTVGVLGALLGALSYGVPALIGLVGTLIYVLALQDSRRRRPVAWVAVVLCLVGIGVGVYASYLYWKGWPPIGPWARGAPTAHAVTGAKR